MNLQFFENIRKYSLIWIISPNNKKGFDLNTFEILNSKRIKNREFKEYEINYKGEYIKFEAYTLDSELQYEYNGEVLFIFADRDLAIKKFKNITKYHTFLTFSTEQI